MGHSNRNNQFSRTVHWLWISLIALNFLGLSLINSLEIAQDLAIIKQHITYYIKELSFGLWMFTLGPPTAAQKADIHLKRITACRLLWEVHKQWTWLISPAFWLIIMRKMKMCTFSINTSGKHKLDPQANELQTQSVSVRWKSYDYFLQACYDDFRARCAFLS